MSKPRIGWRITYARFNERGEITGFYSAYTKQIDEARPPLKVGSVIHAPHGYHVGTKRRFCLSYYRNLGCPYDDFRQVLLKLAIAPEDSPAPKHAWNSRASYMGGEATFTKATILHIESIAESE